VSGVVIYRVLGAIILCAIGVQRYHTLASPVEVRQYHARIRDSVAEVPRQINGWIGRDVPVPVQAITLLQPNLIVSKRYLSVESGLSVGFLLVHCSDAHDMAGHFPLRCYPADGWKVVDQRQRDWQVGSRLITGMEYRFSQAGEIGSPARTITVANFLLRPGGHIVRNMDQMLELIDGAGGQASGAAQVQVCFDTDVADAVRDRAVQSLVGGFEPVLAAILTDATKERAN
jgi:hypothetical protein